MKISISRKVVCSRAGGAQGLWGSCPTSWNPREASQQRILGPRPQAAWGGGGGRGPVGQGGACEPRGRPEAASRVQHGQQTPCRATTAVDRAICCSQVAGALESRVCVGISLPESRKVALEAFGVSPPYGAPRGPELAPAARGVGMGPRLKTPSTQFTHFDVHAHTDTPQTGPSAV